MSFTRDEAQREVSKFLQRSPLLPEGHLGGGSEENRFQRVKETILLSFGTRPEVLFYLRSLGKNRLLTQAYDLAEIGSDLVVQLHNSMTESRGSVSSTSLDKASRNLLSATIPALTGGSSASIQQARRSYRKNLQEFVGGLAPDVTSPVGEEARKSVAQKVKQFVRGYTTLMTEFRSFTVGFEGEYDVASIQRETSSTALNRANRSLAQARSFFAGASKQEVQEKGSAYVLNLIGGSAAMEVSAKFRDPSKPLMRSRNPNAIDSDALPEGTSFRGYVSGETSPARVQSAAPPGFLSVGDSISVAANGGSVVSVPIPGAGLYSLVATSPSLSFSGLSLYFNSGVLTVIPLTNNPPDVATVISDLNAGLPAGSSAAAYGSGIILTSTSPFVLDTYADSAARLLGFLEGAAAALETSAKEVADALNGTSLGLTASTETVDIGLSSGDGYPELGTGAFDAAGLVFSTSVDPQAHGAQPGDLLVVKGGASAGKYTISLVSPTGVTVATSPPSVDSNAEAFYISSSRLVLESVDATTSTSIQTLGASKVGIQDGTVVGQALNIEARGTDGNSPTAVSAPFELYGVAPGDIVKMTSDGTTYSMEVESVSEESVSLLPLSGESSIPSNLSDAQFEISSAMRERSQRLSSSSRDFLVYRSQQKLFDLDSLSQLENDISVSSNNPGQLRSRVRTPMRQVAEFVLSLTSAVPGLGDMQTALAGEGLSLPSISVPTMEEVLLGYEDRSPDGVRAQGKAILQTLEQEGYDRGRALLLTGRVSEFSALSSTEASYAAKLADSLKNVGASVRR